MDKLLNTIELYDPVHNSSGHYQPTDERRLQDNRRHYTVRSMYCCLVHPRRTRGRRTTDRKYPILDVFDGGVMTLAILLILFSIMDAVFTLTLIQHGGTELNPVMNYFLQLGVTEFMLAKLSLTAFPVVILVAAGNLLLFNGCRAVSVLSALVGMYAGLLIYEIGLISLALSSG